MGTLAYDHGAARIDFDLTPLLGRLRALKKEAATLKRLYRIDRFLAALQKYAPYIVADEKAEELAAMLDDAIDDVEEMIPGVGWAKRRLLRSILDRLLHIQFILSNKTADRIGADSYDETL